MSAEKKTPTDTMTSVLQAIEMRKGLRLEEWFESLSIASISADPVFKKECMDAAQWFHTHLESFGFSSRVEETSGHPIVLAHQKGPIGAPHVLFYGHYDVQPVDPLDQWHTPPFSPDLRADSQGRLGVYARGASDDKGQVLTFLAACRGWYDATGRLPVSVTVLLEGEEEIGSPHLGAFLSTHRESLLADVVLVCDTSMFDEGKPGITTHLRGLLHEEMTVYGPSVDLHSGLYGGVVANPISVLSGIIASLHGEDGRLCVPGFYDDMISPSEEIRQAWQNLPFDGETFLSSVGVKTPLGNPKISFLEKMWALPTVDVNGIWGGYTGPGTKTIIPAQASAKLSFRLVPGQDPEKISQRFRAWCETHLPLGYRVVFAPHSGGATKAVHLAQDNPFLQKASAGLQSEWGCAPVLMGSGASIPIVKDFQSFLGLESLLIGFASHDDAIHSPNERYLLENFERGIRSWAFILEALGS